jgi:hypothetical protein
VSESKTEHGNITAVIERNSKGENVLNQTIYTAYDVNNLTVFYTLAVGKDEKDKNYEKVLIRTSVNICRMFQGNQADFIAKTVMNNLANYADFELKCPFKKVHTS